MTPHSLTLTMVGASLLWVGWFGFNAGFGRCRQWRGGLAFINTVLATAAATLSWLAGEVLHKGKASMLGAASGAVAGLVAVTPAAGFVGPMGSIVMGLIAGVVCLWGVGGLKRMLGATMRSTCLACTAWAASSAPSRPACSPRKAWEARAATPTPMPWAPRSGPDQERADDRSGPGVVALVACQGGRPAGGPAWSEEAEREGLDITSHRRNGLQPPSLCPCRVSGGATAGTSSRLQDACSPPTRRAFLPGNLSETASSAIPWGYYVNSKYGSSSVTAGENAHKARGENSRSPKARAAAQADPGLPSRPMESAFTT